MRIYPRFELRPRYKGEESVYQLLSQVPSRSGFAVHSINLPKHEYKRWGEADFVIIEPSGLILLEVKGGVVTLVDREWRYKNARGESIISTEGPARQALSAAVALEEMLSRHMGKKVKCRWGVVFPLCRFHEELVELPPERLADVITCRDVESFEKWLRSIPFGERKGAGNPLSQEEVEAIQKILVPSMTAFSSVGLALRCHSKEVLRLTEQQFAILESLDSNPRLTIKGGAGTGKTELAVLCALAEKAAGRCPALVTAGKPLVHMLRSKMKPYEIPVVTDFLPPSTDVLIVDEGQDLARLASMPMLFSQLPGGITSGRWRWFMDPNLQFMDEPPDPECLNRLYANSSEVTLRRNVRTTREVVSVIQTLLQADVGISRTDGYGIKVGLCGVTDTNDEINVASIALESALNEGVHPAEIAVLGPKGIQGPVCGALHRKFPRILRSLCSSDKSLPSSQGVACSIKDFRGLEAGLVLVVDLDFLETGERGISDLYIAMSRAQTSLRLMLSKEMRSHLIRLIKQQD